MTVDLVDRRRHVRDLDRASSWSPGPGDGDREFHAHMVETRRWGEELALREQLCVTRGDDVEVRLVTLTNPTAARRRLEVTGYAEVVVGDAAEDRRHPAFSKLFVESEYVEALGEQVVADGQRWQEAQHIAESPAGQHDHACGVAACAQRSGQFGVGFHCPRLDQFHRHHRAAPAHIADAVVLRLKPPEPVLHQRLDLTRAVDKALEELHQPDARQ